MMDFNPIDGPEIIGLCSTNIPCEVMGPKCAGVALFRVDGQMVCQNCGGNIVAKAALKKHASTFDHFGIK